MRNRLCSLLSLLMFCLMMSSCGNTQNEIADKKDIQVKLVPDKLLEETNLDIEGHHYEWIRYCLEDEGIRIIGLRTKEDVLVIPASIQGHSVTRIGGTEDEIDAEGVYTEYDVYDAAKEFHIWNTDMDQKLKKIIIPEGVREIVNEGMAYVRAEELVLPESLVLVDEQTFIGCSITRAEIKGEQTTLGHSAFAMSSLKEILFPADFQGTLGPTCFSGSQIEKFHCPESIKKINFLTDCKKLKKVTFSEKQREITIPQGAFTDCLSLKEVTIPANVRTVSIMPNLYADDTKGKGVPTLVFKGKKTELVCVDSSTGKKITGYIPAGKIVAPKGSRAIRTAKVSKKIASFTEQGKKRIAEGEFINDYPDFYERKDLVNLVPVEYEETE